MGLREGVSVVGGGSVRRVAVAGVRGVSLGAGVLRVGLGEGISSVCVWEGGRKTSGCRGCKRSGFKRRRKRLGCSGRKMKGYSGLTGVDLGEGVKRSRSAC